MSEAVLGLLSISGSKNGKASRHVETLVQRSNTAGRGRSDSLDPLFDLAIVHVLPIMAGRLDAGMWWNLLDDLCKGSQQRRITRLDEDVAGSIAWEDQVLAGELPLALAFQLPELRACGELAAVAHDTLTAGLVSLTDGEGLVHARHLPWLRPLFACWTRCLAMAKAAGLPAWDDEAQVQYEWLVRQTLRLTRGDGSQMLGTGPSTAWEPALFETALELAGDDEDVAAAERSLPGDLKLPDADELPCDPAVNSEWSQLSVMRTGWQRSAPRLAISYADREVVVELEAGRETLLGGAWQLEVMAGGRPLSRDDQWEELCWFSDDDVDYLELSADLVGGGRVDRQVLLAREDHFLFLCDHIVNAPSGDLECVSQLPLTGGIEVQLDPETREIELVGKKPRAVVMPLALPEWRIDPRGGQLTHADVSLQLRQNTDARSLSCPLFLDLAPRRFRKQRTWRQLTVAESREICSGETAVAYRVQCSGAQWIFYRSLTQVGNRTFFGQNVSSEFYAARFHRDGEVEELLEIE